MKFDSAPHVIAFHDITGMPLGMWTGQIDPAPGTIEEDFYAYPAIAANGRIIEFARTGEMCERSEARDDLTFPAPVNRVNFFRFSRETVLAQCDPYRKMGAKIASAEKALFEHPSTGDFIRKLDARDLKDACSNGDLDRAKKEIEKGVYPYAFDCLALVTAIRKADAGFVDWTLKNHAPDNFIDVHRVLIKHMRELIGDPCVKDGQVADVLRAVFDNHAFNSKPAILLVYAIHQERIESLKVIAPFCAPAPGGSSNGNIEIAAGQKAMNVAESKASDQYLEILLDAGFKPGRSSRAQAILERMAIEREMEQDVRHEKVGVFVKRSVF